MRDVSFRAVRILAEALSALNDVPVEELLPPEPAVRGWMSWDGFVTWITRIERSKLAPIDWGRVGEASHDAPTMPAVQTFWRSTLSVRFCYWLGCNWFGPANFPIFNSTYQELPDGRLRVVLTVPESLRANRSVFQIFERSLAVPSTKVFGLPEAQVQMTITGQSAEYLITLPQQFTFWSRLRFSFSRFFAPAELLSELAHQQKQLNEQEAGAVQSRADFRAVIEHAPDGIFIHKSGTISYVNPRMASYLRYDDPRDLIGMQVLDIVHPDSRKLEQERMTSLMTGRTGVNPPREMDFLRKDSETFHGEAVALTVTWEGQPAIAVTVRDLSDRKKLQAHLMLSDRMMALGVLAAGVGHEINNPLGYVLLNLEALKKNFGPALLTENAQHIADMEKGLNRIRLIVKDLKAFSRDSDENARVQVNLPAVLQSVVSMARKEIELRARLTTEIQDLPPVLASEARLGQVFLNLLVNASQSIRPGNAAIHEISVRTSVVQKEFRSFALVEVQDTGVGMSDETKKRIFEPFFTTKPVGVGTGLGLSICHSIIEGFSGQIEFESEVGKGTCFKVFLPLFQEKSVKTAVPVPGAGSLGSSAVTSASATRARGKVLIIDDDAALLEMTKFFISEDHEAVALTDAQDALDLLAKGQKFDCILCDLMMPTLNGIQFYQKVSEISPEHLSRILYVTGGSFTEETHAFLRKPEIRHLEKPFDTSHLRELVQEQVARTARE
ncbi:MAG: response regulator [Methylotenera sp.]|nr:response regulator [Oligoflexia bacterium]